MMAKMTRRCKIPVHYSQGCNPRPSISLPAPKPVGITGLDERLIIKLEHPVNFDLDKIFNLNAPAGVNFHSFTSVRYKAVSHPVRLDYRLDLLSENEPDTERKIRRLASMDAWPTRRMQKGRKQKGETKTRILQMDLKPMVDSLRCESGQLYFSCIPVENRWARPIEVLRLVKLDDPYRLSRLVRTKIHDVFIDNMTKDKHAKNHAD